MAWVILGHTFLQALGAPTTNPSYREKVRYTVKLGYNDHGYNEQKLAHFLVPNDHFTK